MNGTKSGYGPVGLLRSLTVAEAYRWTGLGHDLVPHAETWAIGRGIRTLDLLTTTAEKLFAGFGYEVMPRSSAPPAIAANEQFANLCPDSSAFMRKALMADSPLSPTFMNGEVIRNVPLQSIMNGRFGSIRGIDLRPKFLPSATGANSEQCHLFATF